MRATTPPGGRRNGQAATRRQARAARIGALVLAGALLVPDPVPGAEPLRVHVTGYPLAYFVARIGGDRVAVDFPVPAGVDPAFWDPPTAAVLACQQADLIVLNGADYERWVQRASLPRWRLLDSGQALREHHLPSGTGTVHRHGPEGAHAHTGTAFTTWLDPQLALAQATAVRDRLAAIDPSGRAGYDTGLAALADDLRTLDAAFARAFGRIAGAPWLASHPVYQYLARRYGLAVEAVTWEPDADPGEDAWAALQALHAGHPARWMLWEAEPLPAVRERLGRLGIEAVVFAPGGNRPAAGDYLALMQDNLRAIERLAPQ